MVGEQAGAQTAAGREPQPVAAVAEVMAEGADKTDFPRGAGDAVAFGRPVVGRCRHRFQAAHGRQQGLDFRGQQGAHRPHGRFSDGHLLDEAHVNGILEAQGRQIGQFVVIDAAQGHHVDLDRCHTPVQCRHDPVPDLLETIYPGDGGKAFGLQAVETDVDAPHPGRQDVIEAFAQQHPVGGQGDFPDPRQPVELNQQVAGLAAYQRFAAGDAQLGDAEAGRDPGHAEDLLVAQHVGMLQLGDHFPGHAVDATQVAAVGDRDPQIAQVALVLVDEGLGDHDGTPQASKVFNFNSWVHANRAHRPCPAPDRFLPGSRQPPGGGQICAGRPARRSSAAVRSHRR